MKPFRTKYLLAFVAAVALLLAGAACSRERTDALIIGEVVTRIQNDAAITNKNIAVMSAHGVVTLSGTAADEHQRLAVSSDASQVEGVKTVVNNLPVAPLPGPQQASTDAAEPAAVSPKPEEAVQERRVKPSAAHAKARAKESVTAQNEPETYDPSNNTGIVYTSSASASAPSSVPADQPSSSQVQPSSTTNQIAQSTAIRIPPPPLPLKMLTIESGTPITVRLVDSIDTSHNQRGDTFHATLDSPIYVGDEIAVPEGAGVDGRIVEMEDSGRFSGRPQIGLILTSLAVNNRRYSLQTNQYTKEGSSQGTRTAKTVGVGAGLGALIGAIAGGGKGAAIGAAVGAAGGGGVQAARGAQAIRLGSEARLRFQLESPISVAPVSSLNRNSNNVYDSASAQSSSDASYNDNAATPVGSPDGDRPVLKRRPPKNSEDQPN
jgi:hypothetical protein